MNIFLDMNIFLYFHRYNTRHVALKILYLGWDYHGFAVHTNIFLYFHRYNTRHVALKILYLGWDYHGFAVQEDTEKTIEAALFDALIKTKLIESR